MVDGGSAGCDSHQKGRCVPRVPRTAPGGEGPLLSVLAASLCELLVADLTRCRGDDTLAHLSPDSGSRRMNPICSFEPGYDLVLGLDRTDRARRACCPWAVARRRGILRVEYGAGRAWEFDDAGRLLRTEHRDRWRQFTLDQRSWGQVVIGVGAQRRLRNLAGEVDAASRVRNAHSVVRALHAALVHGKLQVSALRGEVQEAKRIARDWLEDPCVWSDETLAADRDRIRRLLLPVPVLPPDQYGSLPIQLTEGCSWDACSFCSLYKGVRYRERSPAEIASLLDALLEHLGASVGRFRRLFLGQANALLLKDDLLHAHLDVIDARFARAPAVLGPAARRRWIDQRPGAVEGFSAFLDAFHRPRSVASWRRLRERGLLRVHIGIESGSERLLREFGKPVRNARVEELIAALHEAEVPIGLIFLAGVGEGECDGEGEKGREQEHVEATASLLGRLALRARDQVFLSPLEQRGDAPERRASLVATRRMHDRLRSVVPRGVAIATYDLHLLAQRTPRS